tara:strand:+ start:1165 stop:1320 length:156 start_codon:yes stop_codon:yes gene_type:complete
MNNLVSNKNIVDVTNRIKTDGICVGEDNIELHPLDKRQIIKKNINIKIYIF